MAAVELTENMAIEQLHKLMNFAKSRYREIKNMPGAPKGMTEEIFVACYLVAHKDIMQVMSKGVADVSKRRIYTV